MMTIILIVLFLWSLVLTFVICSAFIGFISTRVPFVATTNTDVADLVKNLPITQNDTVIDLGSGDARVLFLIEDLTGATVIGYELTLWTHMWALLKKSIKRSQAHLYRKNFFHEPWQEATIVYGYLYPPLMARVEEKFLAECKPGTIAVIRDFALPNLKPDRVISSDHKIHAPRLGILNKKEKTLLLLKSLIPGKLRPVHEFFIYTKF